MHTRRSFLAFAAAAQLLSPIARAMQVRDCRPLVARFPQIMLQTHEGRDVYFCNDRMAGRLAILNLQYADSASLRLPPRVGEQEAYLYSLTLQPAVANRADLRRYMEAYRKGTASPFLNGTPEEFELLRLRRGIYTGT